MDNNNAKNERRFNQRSTATGIDIEIYTAGWFGLIKRKQRAVALDFGLGGISVVSSKKLKPNQKVFITLDSERHRLQAIPMLVIRCLNNNKGYVSALRFNLSDLPEAARTAAYAAFKSIENELKRSVAA